MSHYAVMVITDEEPTEEVLTRTLQPWHEYECTGTEDEYVVDVDVTDRVEEVWNEDCAVLKLSDGWIVSRYNERFYIRPESTPDDPFPREVFVMPAGATEMTIPRSKLCAIEGQSKIEFAEEYGNWTFKDGRFWDRTNPNAKWDWWTVGGRYSGRLQVVSGAPSRTGERGLGNEDAIITGVDQARRGDLALAAMISDRQKERREWAEDCCAKAKRTMDDLNIACQLAPLAHEKWMALDEDSRPRGAEYTDWMESLGDKYPIYAAFRRDCFELPDVPEGMSLIEWIEAAPAISAWAVVLDGQWIESGSMGWWGMSSDDKPDWDQMFNKIWDSIKPNQWVSFVDCHI